MLLMMKKSFIISLREILFIAATFSVLGGFFSIDGSSNDIIGGCKQSERNALLDVKAQLTDPLNQLASWDVNVESDCCKWYGVVCDNSTGQVLQLRIRSPSYKEYFLGGYYNRNDTRAEYMSLRIGGEISSSLLKLKHLRYLDLSHSYFGGIPIPEFLGSMKSLRYLNLSCSGFGGMIPHQLGNMSNLLYLNLGCRLHDLGPSLELTDNIRWISDWPSFPLHVENLCWLSGLSSLKFLALSRVDLSKTLDWLKMTNMLPSLFELRLHFCSLPLHISSHLYANFSSLTTLDLSFNRFIEPSIPNWIFGLRKLISLDLGYNNFEGPISDSFQNMTSLKELLLYCNHFSSYIPNWLGSFNHLETLDLSRNKLQGRIPSEIGNITSLVILNLSGNQLEGRIPTSFKALCKLTEMYISSNKLRQEINEVFDILTRHCISNVLEVLYMHDCKFFGRLTNQQLVQFKNLQYVGLSYIWLPSGVDWPLLRLKVLHLRYCNFGSQFPSWVRSLQSLEALDLSNTGISGQIPFWFWNFSPNLRHVNLSHNKIYGELQEINASAKRQLVIDLNSNCLTGSLPSVLSNIFMLDLSRNSFSGSISKFLCHNIDQMQQTEILNIGENHLSGEMPNCWMKWKNLVVLRLNNNNFNGSLPPSIGSLSSVQYLHLENNKLSGSIPLELSWCLRLISLDLHGNRFNGQIPTWIGKNFSEMVILNLRSNRFQGHIPKELCQISFLHILDLSGNKLSGSIPKCIDKFKQMTSHDDISSSIIGEDAHVESMLLIIKGRESEFASILNLVRTIDFSSNLLSGNIPEEVTSLRGLCSLNLSHNMLTGEIPKGIGVMQYLESLDFSQNQLSGKIPPGITQLMFLNNLNLSCNNLTGEIPSSTQLQSFNSSSFIHNDLCGDPLPRKCNKGASDAPSIENEDKLMINWFYVSMSIGFGMGLWIVLGPLLFCRRWRYAYFRFLYRLSDKIGWRFARLGF